jgi:DNA-binding winged helix-turn-helix (wHTH) protein
LDNSLYKFGPFTLNAQEHLLLKTTDGQNEMISLEPKVFDTLVVFLENPSRLLSKDKLAKLIWPDLEVVGEFSVSTIIRKLRKALGDSKETPQFISTVHRKGYRWVGSHEDDAGRRVLLALDGSDYALRSSDGLAGDTGIELSELESILAELRVKRLVEMKAEESGQRWYITKKGREVLKL